MRSLKLEAKNLALENNEWFGSFKTTTPSSRTRTQRNNHKRRRSIGIVKETTFNDYDDRRQKRRLFSSDDDDEGEEWSNSGREEEADYSDVEILSCFSEETKSTNEKVETELDEGINGVCAMGSTELDLMVDKDYMAYLEYTIETLKGDFDAMSNPGIVDCERVSKEQVHNVEDKCSNEERNVASETTNDNNVDCRRVSVEGVDIMEDKGCSERLLYVSMDGIVYDKITDDENVGCDDSDRTVCVYEGVSPEQVGVDDKCDAEYLEHGDTNAYSDLMSMEGNLDAHLEMLPDLVNCGSQSSGEDDVDPDYKMFLVNVREDAYSYVFESKKDDGTTVLVKYEEDNDKLIEGTPKDEEAYLDYSSCQERMNDLKEKVMPKPKVLVNDVGMTNGSPAEQPRRMTPHWFLSGCKPGTISSTDESYLKFLDHVWVEGDSLIFKYEGVTVKYGDDSRVAADPQGLEQKDAGYCNEVKFTPYTDLKTSKVSMSEDDLDAIQILDSRKSDYKKEFEKLLRKEISKPYDKYELKVSLKNARVRKWKELDKETRGTSFSVPTKCKRKSYVGHYPDLRKLLDRALEEPFPRKRALALLRCLFFFLKHQPHPGKFVPWRYPPTWLHDKICCCKGNLKKCPIEKRQHSKNQVLILD